jgi:hypothetical protein
MVVLRGVSVLLCGGGTISAGGGLDWTGCTGCACGVQPNNKDKNRIAIIETVILRIRLLF